MPRALTESSSMLYVFVDIPASLVHHQTPFLTRLKSCPVGQGIPGFDAYSALLLRHVGQAPRRGIPCRCGQTAPPSISQRSRHMQTVYVQRISMSAAMSEAAMVPKGIPECVAQAVALTIQRR